VVSKAMIIKDGGGGGLVVSSHRPSFLSQRERLKNAITVSNESGNAIIAKLSL